MTDTNQSQMPDNYDRLLGQLEGLPDVSRTKQSIVRVMPPFGIGGSETFFVQTVRQRGTEKEASKDTIFVEHVKQGTAYRMVMPAEVASVIARQRDQLSSMNRRKGARQAVETRKERGIEPGFLRKRKR